MWRDWKYIFRHNRASLTKDALLERFKSVFDGGLGEFPGLVHLELDTSVLPVIVPLRRVPIAVRDRLEEELVRLEELDVISKVSEPMGWVSGFVLAEKKDGSLRVCIDPKPLNKAQAPYLPLTHNGRCLVLACEGQAIFSV